MRRRDFNLGAASAAIASRSYGSSNSGVAVILAAPTGDWPDSYAGLPQRASTPSGRLAGGNFSLVPSSLVPTPASPLLLQSSRSLRPAARSTVYPTSFAVPRSARPASSSAQASCHSSNRQGSWCMQYLQAPPYLPTCGLFLSTFSPLLDLPPPTAAPRHPRMTPQHYSPLSSLRVAIRCLLALPLCCPLCSWAFCLMRSLYCASAFFLPTTSLLQPSLRHFRPALHEHRARRN